MIIRAASDHDWPRIWPFFASIVAAGETYAYPDGLILQTGRPLWMEVSPGRTVVATEGDVVVGSAKMGPNRPGRGAHVATASFMVDPAHQGRGVGRALGRHAIEWAQAAGYRSMQFNAVVETNTAAVQLWRSLGFVILATVPEAFDHRGHEARRPPRDVPAAIAPRYVAVMSGTGEARDGVQLTNLDQPLFDGAGATKRNLVDYLDAVHGRIIPELRDRPLSVVRVLRGQAPFMQKNVPKYTPEWVRTVPLWAESSKREVSYALCDDRRTLLWFANQRAVEYHPTLVRADRWDRATYLVLDLDPPYADAFPLAVRAAHLVRQALTEVGLAGAVKTSGAKGVHVFVPIDAQATIEEVAAATRAIAVRAERLDPALATTAFIREDRGGKVFLDSTRAGGATVVAAYSPRVRPGVPVSFPVAWDELDRVAPGDFTVHTAARLIGDGDPWAKRMPAPQRLGADLIEEGRAIPVARVQAMHEGKRRARARRKDQ